MAFEKKIFATKKELKLALINFFVDESGRKVSKYKLRKDKEFLRAIKYKGVLLSSGTISNYCKSLENIEPVGIINEQFLFDYHKNITKRISQETTFEQFSKNKLAQGKGFMSDRSRYLMIAEKYLGIYPDFSHYEDTVIKKYLITAADGKSYNAKHYNLQMIIAVGFKVNNEQAVQFRKWANLIVKDYTIKGWVMDDERLKRGTYLTEKYFDEQLERIREIRASERKFYQKITDLYATAIDYDKNSATTRRFYATVQNKMHYAVHGHTAAELIVERADHTREHMGLTTWADAPDGKIKKSDVTVAKNYLSQDEMKQLNRMVTAYLDFAENMTLRHIPFTMQDWEKRLNSFIEMFDYGILQDAGKVSAEIAKLHAETEFEKYRVIQDRLFMSDFDKYMLELEENTKK